MSTAYLGDIVAITRRGMVRLQFPPDLLAKPHRDNLPGSILRKEDGRWGINLPRSQRAYRMVRRYFGDLGIPVRFDNGFDRQKAPGPVGYTRNFHDDDPLPDIPRTTSDPPPWDCQRRAFWFAVDRLGGKLDKAFAAGGALIGLDMGCGKTRVAIDLVQNYDWSRVLVVCPKKVVDVWPYEWGKYSIPEADVRVIPLLGTTAKRADTIRRELEFSAIGGQTVFVVNYEAFDQRVFKAAVEGVSWDALILDEGHRIKDPGGKRSRWFGAFADQVPVRLELTGTKEPNSPLDIFAQGRFLDRSLYGTRFDLFRSEYAILGPTPDGKVVRILGYKNHEDLARKNFEFCFEVRAEDVQDLPEEHHVDVPVTLSKRSREIYDEFDEEFCVELAGEEISAANVLVKIGKLSEITGGYLRDPATGRLFAVGTDKRDALAEKLADLPPSDPVVIFYRFTPDADALAEVCDGLGRPHYEVSGRRNDLAAWQGSDGNEVLICQIGAGKEGVDLTRSRWGMYFSLGYQPGEFNQSKKRQNRPGQLADRVTFFHFVAVATKDEAIYTAIAKKQRVIDEICRLAREG